MRSVTLDTVYVGLFMAYTLECSLLRHFSPVYRYVAETFPAFVDKLKAHGGMTRGSAMIRCLNNIMSTLTYQLNTYRHTARYKRILPSQDDEASPIGRSFYNAYQVENKADLEKKLNSIEGLEYEWTAEGNLEVITEPIPAIRMVDQQHNHGIYQWTFNNSVIAAFRGWQDCRNDRKQSVCFGNNDTMDADVLEAIATFSELACNAVSVCLCVCACTVHFD